MKELLLVGTGSLLGGLSRYYMSGWIQNLFTDYRFPLGTFVVNVSGCFLIGILAGLAEHQQFFSSQLRLFLITGILGGFTTFSAFGYETIYLMRTGFIDIAILNVVTSIIVGLAAVWCGLRFFI